MFVLTKDAFIQFLQAAIATGTTAQALTVDMGQSPEFDSVCFITQIGTPNAANIAKAGSGALANGSDASDLAGTHVTPTGSGPAGIFVDVVKPPGRYVTFTMTRGSTTILGDVWAVFYNAHSGPISSVATTPLPLFGSTNIAPVAGTA